MHTPPALHLGDYVGPVLAAWMFVLLASLIREPERRTYNAMFVAGATGVYLNGGLGLWELLYVAVAGTIITRFALQCYRVIGAAWLMHASWDLVHHLYANPIWPFMPTSSFGCLVFDTEIAIWFLAGAPSPFATAHARPAHDSGVRTPQPSDSL